MSFFHRFRRLLLAAIAVVSLAAIAVVANAAFTHKVQNDANAARAASVFKPLATSAPTITGTTREKQTLTGSDGTWARQPDTFQRQWLRCDSQGDACDPIANATSTTYTAAAADVGNRLRLKITASNAGGSVTATSTPTSTIDAAPQVSAPVNTALPTLDGAAVVDATLTASTGTWTGEPTYSFQWQRCSSTGTGCVTLNGETGRSYRLDAADVNYTFRAVVTAQNEGGTRTAGSALTTAVGRRSYTYVACANPDTGKGVGPANGSAPAGFGRDTYGDGVTAHSVTWRCGAGETAPEMSQSQSMHTYTPHSGIRYRYYAPSNVTMVGGSVWRWLSFSGPLGSSFTTQPSSGLGFGVPNFAACWHNFGCSSMGSTSSRFGDSNRVAISTDAPAGFSFTMHCHTNGYLCQASGQNAIYGARIALRDNTTPTLVAAASGSLLTETEFTGSASVALDARDTGSGLYRVRVLLDNEDIDAKIVSSNNGACADVKTTNTDKYEFATHTPCATSYTGSVTFNTRTWPSGTHRMHVLLEDAGRNTITLAKRTVIVPADAPESTGAPTVSGTEIEGEQLSGTAGTWANAQSTSLQWLRCDSAGANCTSIDGATSASYTLAGADIGKRLRLRSIAKNATGTSTADSAATGAVVGLRQTVTYTRDQQGVVRLRGEIVASTTYSNSTKLGTLPDGFRPAGTLMGYVPIKANGGSTAGIARVDIESNGTMTYLTTISGSDSGAAGGKINLDDFQFLAASASVTAPSSFGAPWGNYGGSYEGAGSAKDANGIVRLRGLVRNSAGVSFASNGRLFTLPAGSAPAIDMQFIVPCHDGSYRVCRIEVRTDGSINVTGALPWHTGASGSWISLAGVAFPAASNTLSWTPLDLPSGWTTATGESTASLASDGDGITYLRGTITRTGGAFSPPTTLASVPSAARPAVTTQRLVAAYDPNLNIARAQVEVNGDIARPELLTPASYVGSFTGANGSAMHLTGWSFPSADSALTFKPLPLTSPWAPAIRGE